MRKKGGKCIYLFLDPSPQQKKPVVEKVFPCRDSRLMGKHNVDEMSDCKMCLYDKCGPARFSCITMAHTFTC